MSWLRRIFGSCKGQEVFTPEAKRLWESIAEETRARIVQSVWCVRCKSPTGIPLVDYGGKIEAGDLLLTGKCARCGSKVTRLVEGEMISNHDSYGRMTK